MGDDGAGGDRAIVRVEEVETPLAEVPYSLRQAGLSLVIRSGVDPVEAARRAGHSVAVLFRFYAKVIKNRQDENNALIARALTSADSGTDDGA